MAVLRITYGTEEELCQALTVISERLRSSGRCPSEQELLRLLGRSSSGRQRASITGPVGQPTAQPSAESATPLPVPSFGEAGDFTSPAFLDAVAATQAQIDAITPFPSEGTAEDPFFRGHGLGQILDSRGNIIPPGSIVMDDFGAGLLDAGQKKRPPQDLKLLGAMIAGGSRALAAILNLKSETVSEDLARKARKTVPQIHIQLAAPFIGSPAIGGALEQILLSEANELLLRKDATGLARLIGTTQAEKDQQTGASGSFMDKATAALTINLGSVEKSFDAILDRQAGNLAILQIEMQEEF